MYHCADDEDGVKPSHFPQQFLDKNVLHRLRRLAHSDHILPFFPPDVGPENPPYAVGFGMTQGSCKSATRSQIDSEAFARPWLLVLSVRAVGLCQLLKVTPKCVYVYV